MSSKAKKAKKKNLNPSFAVIISMEVYPFEVMLSVNQDNDQLGAELGKYPNLREGDIQACAYPSEFVQGRAVLFSTGASIIRLRKLPTTSKDYGVLAHEIFHIVTFVLDRVGMSLNINTSDEAYAYLTGYLTEKIYEAMNKYY